MMQIADTGYTVQISQKRKLSVPLVWYRYSFQYTSRVPAIVVIRISLDVIHSTVTSGIPLTSPKSESVQASYRPSTVPLVQYGTVGCPRVPFVAHAQTVARAPKPYGTLQRRRDRGVPLPPKLHENEYKQLQN